MIFVLAALLIGIVAGLRAMMAQAVPIHPTVSELLPTMMVALKPAPEA